MAAIGIDFGTTNCRVAVCRNGSVQVIDDTIPSVIAFGNDLIDPLIGREAQEQVSTNPLNTVIHISRLLGKRMAEFNVEKSEKRFWSFRIFDPLLDDNIEPKITVKLNNTTQRFSVVQIVSMFLKRLKDIAQQHIRNESGGQELVNSAVISVPTLFNHSQRRAIKVAAERAGLNVLRILNETSAIAITYGVNKVGKTSHEEEDHHVDNKGLGESSKREFLDLNKKLRSADEENILVFDFGGGTLSMAVIRIIRKDRDGLKKFQVKSVAGNTHLGGKDLDDRIIRLCIDNFAQGHQDFPADTFTNYDREQDTSEDVATSMSKLRSACETAKIDLSSGTKDATTIQLYPFYKGFNFSYTLSLKEFEDINTGFFNKCERAISQCLRDPEGNQYSVDKVIAVGGSNRIPRIRGMLQSCFNANIEFEEDDIVMENSVALGAAIQASLLKEEGLRLSKVSENSVLDVTAFEIIIERANSDVRTSLITRNTVLPTQADHTFTALEGQQTAIYRVYEQGQDSYINFLGIFEVEGIPPCKLVRPEIIATFKIDCDGILNGSALDTGHTLDESTGTLYPVPPPSSDPTAYVPKYYPYKCSVKIGNGRLSPEELQALKDHVPTI